MCSLVLRFTLRSFRLTATKQEAAEDANIWITVLFLTSLFTCTTCPTEAWNWWKFRWHAQVGIWWRNDRILPFEDVTWTQLCRNCIYNNYHDPFRCCQWPESGTVGSVRKQPAAVVWRRPVRIGQRRPLIPCTVAFGGSEIRVISFFFKNL